MNAAVSTDRTLIVEDHPKFPEWLAAFEQLVNAHERLKAAGPDASNVADLQKGLAAAKAAYLKLADGLG
jgi:hypothetical protein